MAVTNSSSNFSFELEALDLDEEEEEEEENNDDDASFKIGALKTRCSPVTNNLVVH